MQSIDLTGAATYPLYETVDDGHECPRCGEFRMDWLVWAEDDSHVECATCGRRYLPGAEEETNA